MTLTMSHCQNMFSTSVKLFQGSSRECQSSIGGFLAQTIKKCESKVDNDLLWCPLCCMASKPVVPHTNKSAPSTWSIIYHLLFGCSSPAIILLRTSFLHDVACPAVPHWHQLTWEEHLGVVALLQFDSFNSASFAFATGAFLANVFALIGIHC